MSNYSAIFILVPGATQGFGLSLPKSSAHHSSHQEQSRVLDLKAAGQQRHTGTQLGEALREATEPGPGKKFLSSRQKAHPRTEGGRGGDTALLEHRQLWLIAGMVSLGALTSLPLYTWGLCDMRSSRWA